MIYKIQYVETLKNMFISTLQCIENLHYSDLLNSSMSESSSVTMPQSVRWVQKSPMSESSSVAMPQSVRWVRKSSEWVIFSNSDHVCQVSTDVLYEWIIFSNDVPVCQVSTVSSMSESSSVTMSQSVRWVQMSSMSKPLDIVYTSIYL